MTLAAWHGSLTSGRRLPERALVTVGTIDRLLAVLGARIALRMTFLESARLRRFARRTVRLGEELRTASDDALKARATELRVALHREGVTEDLASQSFALAAEASFRLLGKRPYPVQFMGGYAMLRGSLIEMATGEGKTLTALLPSLTLALAGVPVHVITVNDYLARRDAEYVRAVLTLFSISIGVVTHVETEEEKRLAYLSDVTYCVNKDVVFDHLRDSLKGESAGNSLANQHSQRGLYFALVDEADGILIDEARTPLIIARERPIDAERRDAMLALELARGLRPGHFRAEEHGRQYRLTHEGRFFLASQELVLQTASPEWRLAKIREERVERALSAVNAFKRGSQYVIQDSKVQIVDEFTGRILPDRTWERGLHQMIELKEGLDVTPPRETIAKQTYPEFFSRYLRIAGMTGTGSEVAGEIRANFGMRTVRIPTNRPGLRKFLGVRLFAASQNRWEAIAARATSLASQGRAVLIGTRSVSASEELSAVLTRMGQPHRVLNALQDHLEAEIVAEAGQSQRITVATNMAGRGTDIELAPGVRAAGGLHVILSEFHESRRIDRQLYGRAGRQGDAGSCEAIVSLDDALFVQFCEPLVRWLLRTHKGREELPSAWGLLLSKTAQWRAERKNAAVRHGSSENEATMRKAMAFSGRER
jgi:preprotein translocase subunit SecA